jgi:ADP-ribose pyrophosphatase YjhB (NUDIX family)
LGQVVKAMGVIRRDRDGALLVSEYTGPDGPPFQRPLGGHVEFGERAAQTLHREFGEEIGQALTDVRLLDLVRRARWW